MATSVNESAAEDEAADELEKPAAEETPDERAEVEAVPLVATDLLLATSVLVFVALVSVLVSILLAEVPVEAAFEADEALLELEPLAAAAAAAEDPDADLPEEEADDAEVAEDVVEAASSMLVVFVSFFFFTIVVDSVSAILFELASLAAAAAALDWLDLELVAAAAADEAEPDCWLPELAADLPCEPKLEVLPETTSVSMSVSLIVLLATLVDELLWVA